MNRLALVVAIAVAACTKAPEPTEAEKKIAADTSAERQRLGDWIEAGAPGLCPLQDAQGWVAPLGSIEFGTVGDAPDQLRAVISFWCRGQRDGQTTRLAGVATIPPKGNFALDYDALTIAGVEAFGAGRIFLYWFVYPCLLVLGLLLVARFFPVHALMSLPTGGDGNTWASPWIGLPMLAALTIAASCVWTRSIFHASWAYALTPLQIIPTFALLARLPGRASPG